jgi:hypothetical protein
MTELVDRQVALARTAGAVAHTAIFLHIGKTAGTTLTKALGGCYPRRAVFDIDTHTTAPPSSQVESLQPEELERLRLVRGHLLYGLHTVLPLSALYFTLLREPYARLISAYRHVLRTPTHRIHAGVFESGMNFGEFVTSGITLETDNWQLRCIAGDEITPFGGCDERMLDRAKANIARQFALVGLSERFDESLVLLSRMYDWDGLRYVSLNRGSGPSFDDLSDSQRAAVEPHIALDRELYSYAANVLDSVIDGLDGVDEDVAALRHRNMLYSPLGRARERLRRPLRRWAPARRAAPREGRGHGGSDEQDGR